MKLLIVLLIVAAVAQATPTAVDHHGHGHDDLLHKTIAQMTPEERAVAGARWREIQRVCGFERCRGVSEECDKCVRPCMMSPAHNAAGEALINCMFGEIPASCARTRHCSAECQNSADKDTCLAGCCTDATECQAVDCARFPGCTELETVASDYAQCYASCSSVCA